MSSYLTVDPTGREDVLSLLFTLPDKMYEVSDVLINQFIFR